MTDATEPGRPAPADADEDLLIELVQRALEQQEQDGRVDLAAVCAEHPELQGAVADVLGLDTSLGEMTSRARDADPRVGQVFAGRYRILAALGRGAMGVVYRAHDEQLRRDVAVKTFLAGSGATQDTERVARFVREARVLAALRHPHVVVVHDQGRCGDGELFVVMELLDGVPLSAALELTDDRAAGLAALLHRPLEGLAERSWLRLLAHLLADVADGLEVAHAQGIVHRDVKPSNIQLRADGRAVLLDFGIAACADDPGLTGTASQIGTPWYMAPEQARGGAATDPRIDVYGLAASLYHLATGQPPYAGDGRQVVQSLLEGDPPPPRRLVPGLPVDLCAIIERGMERESARRYPSAAAFAADLRAFLDHRPTVARPLTPLGRGWRRLRRRPTRYALVAVASLLMVTLLVGVPVWRSQRAAERMQEWRESFAGLPALLAIEGLPGQRLAVDRAERGRSLAVLDRLLELEPGDVACRLWRAALRQDQGDAAGARDDLEALAGSGEQSPYLAALAARYAAADAALRGIDAIDLVGLPAPQAPLEHWVAGFHELRDRTKVGFAGRAVAHLRAAIDGGVMPARDLLLVALLAEGEFDRRPAAFAEAFELAAELRGVYGRDTARTAFASGTALLAQGQYREALAPLELALELRPDRHGPLHNLGLAWRRLGDPERALGYLQRAAALRPDFLNTQVTIAQVMKDLGQFDEALRLAAELPDDGTGRLAWRRPEVEGGILLQRAIAGFRDDPAAAIADATAAMHAFDRATEVARGIDRRLASRLSKRAVTAANLAAGVPAEAAASLLNQLLSDPDDAYQLANLEELLGHGPLDPFGHKLLRMWLLRLALQVAEGDERFSERITARYLAVKQESLPEPDSQSESVPDSGQDSDAEARDR